MINIAVCDDSFVYCHKIMSLLELILSDKYYFIDEFSNGEELLKTVQLEKISYHLFILDIDMPKIDGLKTASILRSIKRLENCMIVFLTNYDVSASITTKLHPYAYIKKTSSDSVIKAQLEKCIEKINIDNSLYLVKNYENSILVSPGSISYIESKSRHTFFHLTDGSVVESTKPFSETMKKLEQISSHIAQCHRSYAINVSFLKSFKNASLLLNDDTRIPFNKKYRDNLLKPFRVSPLF